MTDRSGWVMVVMIICAVVALALHTCTPRNVYRVEQAEYTAEDYSAIAELVVTKMDAAGMYDQYKAKTLPGMNIHTYISKVESSVIGELELERDTQIIGKTAPWTGWLFAAGASIFFFLMLIFFLIGDSRWWRAMVNYWNVKGELKKELNKEQVKTLKEVVRIQNKILKGE